jgi:hypothetical protein
MLILGLRLSNTVQLLERNAQQRSPSVAIVEVHHDAVCEVSRIRWRIDF